MSGRLVLLGTKGGPAIRPGGPNPTSTLLTLSGRRMVIDCGLGVSRGLVETGMSLKELDLVFITHLHSDHVLELGPLIHTAWTTGLDHPALSASLGWLCPARARLGIRSFPAKTKGFC